MINFNQIVDAIVGKDEGDMDMKDMMGKFGDKKKYAKDMLERAVAACKDAGIDPMSEMEMIADTDNEGMDRDDDPVVSAKDVMASDEGGYEGDEDEAPKKAAPASKMAIIMKLKKAKGYS